MEMKMSSEQLQKAVAWVNRFQHPCQACGQNVFDVDQTAYVLLALNIRTKETMAAGVHPGGGTIVVAVKCTACGNQRFCNADHIGIVPK